MATSIVNNADFRAMLTRKAGALGSELQALTARAFVYSTWSLRCMETAERKLWTQKEGKETRYFLLTAKQIAAEHQKVANAAAKIAAKAAAIAAKSAQAA